MSERALLDLAYPKRETPEYQHQWWLAHRDTILAEAERTRLFHLGPMPKPTQEERLTSKRTRNREYGVKWRRDNPERHNEINRRWARNHPKSVFAIGRRNREKLKLEVLSHYGGSPPRCACCGETDLAFLTISHVNNDGSEHRKGLMNGSTRNPMGTVFYHWLKRNDFPSDPPLIVECYNCNCGKRCNGGVCPHKR